mmetsp:Transcript_37268/g.27517  ORF Transcript_37268/g.27517 Transcript_37268/m.27517 type:complete len:195 (+) Transcript_37268:552-1136(+)
MLDVITDLESEKRTTYAVFEYYSINLTNYIQYHLCLKSPEVRSRRIMKIMWQLLEGVRHLHSQMIMHRDLKPDNILLDKRGNVRIGDFGLGKKISFAARRNSNSIVSLWYRAPEVILGSESYDFGVDVWSLGCIFGELLIGRPLFNYSKDNVVLDKIFKLLGTPNLHYCPHLLKLDKYQTLDFGYHKGAQDDLG